MASNVMFLTRMVEMLTDQLQQFEEQLQVAVNEAVEWRQSADAAENKMNSALDEVRRLTILHHQDKTHITALTSQVEVLQGELQNLQLAEKNDTLDMKICTLESQLTQINKGSNSSNVSINSSNNNTNNTARAQIEKLRNTNAKVLAQQQQQQQQILDASSSSSSSSSSFSSSSSPSTASSDVTKADAPLEENSVTNGIRKNDTEEKEVQQEKATSNETSSQQQQQQQQQQQPPPPPPPPPPELPKQVPLQIRRTDSLPSVLASPINDDDWKSPLSSPGDLHNIFIGSPIHASSSATFKSQEAIEHEDVVVVAAAASTSNTATASERSMIANLQVELAACTFLLHRETGLLDRMKQDLVERWQRYLSAQRDLHATQHQSFPARLSAVSSSSTTVTGLRFAGSTRVSHEDIAKLWEEIMSVVGNAYDEIQLGRARAGFGQGKQQQGGGGGPRRKLQHEDGGGYGGAGSSSTGSSAGGHEEENDEQNIASGIRDVGARSAHVLNATSNNAESTTTTTTTTTTNSDISKTSSAAASSTIKRGGGGGTANRSRYTTTQFGHIPPSSTRLHWEDITGTYHAKEVARMKDYEREVKIAQIRQKNPLSLPSKTAVASISLLPPPPAAILADAPLPGGIRSRSNSHTGIIMEPAISVTNTEENYDSVAFPKGQIHSTPPPPPPPPSSHLLHHARSSIPLSTSSTTVRAHRPAEHAAQVSAKLGAFVADMQAWRSSQRTMQRPGNHGNETH